MFTLIALGDRDGLPLQPRRHLPAGCLPGECPAHGRYGAGLLRGRRRHHRPGPARTGAGTPGARGDRWCHPRPAEPGAEDRAPHPAGRLGRGDRPRRCAGRRSAACPARRWRAGGRRGAGGPRRRRRVDGDGRVHARREGARRQGDRRHGQRHRRSGHPGRQGRLGHHAVPHRRHGGRRPAEPSAHPAHGRHGVRLLRPGGHRGRGPGLRRLDGLGPDHPRCPTP